MASWNSSTILILIILSNTCYFSTDTAEPESPLATISEGILRGATGQTLTGRDYFQFKGIPYARKPKRFQVRFQSMSILNSEQHFFQLSSKGKTNKSLNYISFIIF